MDSKDIIKAIDEFFMTADESALAEVTAALSTNIDGDISIEEYLSGFSNEFFYTKSPESNVYVYTDKRLNPSSHFYQSISFENTETNYEESNIKVLSKMEVESKDDVIKMVKKAA